MRNTSYTQEVADAICERLETGCSLRKACEDVGGISEAKVRNWSTSKEYPAFVAQYALAREAGYRCLADQIIEISDDSSGDTVDTEHGPKPNPEFVARSRLRVDSRKWMLSKMLPKLYGDKIETTLQVGDTVTKIFRQVIDPKAE